MASPETTLKPFRNSNGMFDFDGWKELYESDPEACKREYKRFMQDLYRLLTRRSSATSTRVAIPN